MNKTSLMAGIITFVFSIALCKLDDKSGACMKKVSRIIIVAGLSLCSIVFSGCRLIVQPKLIESDEIKSALILDPNTYNIAIERDPNSSEVSIKITKPPTIHHNGITQINYSLLTKTACVKGTIDGHAYPVLFDTGNSTLSHITTWHVNENQLPIIPLKYLNQENKEVNYGLAMIDEIHIGSLTINNLPAIYDSYSTGYQLFGLNFANVGQDKEIVLPLTVMQGFKYIKFDNINKNMELSSKHHFTITNSIDWKSYPIHTKNNRIYIETTLEGFPVLLMIDTGAEGSLVLTKDCFDALIENNPKLEKSWKLSKTGFAPLAGGEFQYESYLTWGFKFDKCEYESNTIINIVEEGGIYKFFKDMQLDGMIGFEFFDKTAMVLDFEKNLLWVKKAKGSRFEK